MMKTKEIKERNGITMVSLIVTIVVLLILASVSISMIMGENGVINISKNKIANTKEKAAREEVKMIVAEYDIANAGETLEEYLKTKVPSRLEEVKRIDDKTLVVKKDGLSIEVESENRDFSIITEPYVGTYDGETHNALSSINVTPSSAKVEYSTDGTKFVDDMPTITNASSITVTIRVSKTGYKTTTVSKVARVDKADGQLKLSAMSGKYIYPTSGTFTASENIGSLSVSSSNTNIATVSISGNTITVKPGTTAGTAQITVTSAATENYNEKTLIHTATVDNGKISLAAIPYVGTYDGKAHNALTNVTVTPSDAKIEYSTDGTNYSTTMPTITNTLSFTVTVRATKTGYKTQTVTETVKVNKATGTLTLSETSGTIDYPNSKTFTVSGNTGTLSVVSSNTSVATASISGNTVTIKSVAAGTATITVTSAASTNYTEKTATYSVTVKNSTFTGNSGVGYYADTDGDGTVDGIIFEDFQKGGSGSWGGQSYKISTVSDTKSYYVSQESYNGPFGTKKVLATKETSGNERFYVMALSDYNNGKTYAFIKDTSITSGSWRIPDIVLLAAFGGELEITTSNYSDYGLSNIYWSTSVTNYLSGLGFYASFSSGEVGKAGIANSYPVRLARTF